MSGSETFKIVIGTAWRSSSEEGFRPLFPESYQNTVDFGSVRDSVDIVVDGTSLGSGSDEDSIFYLVRDLLQAVANLAAGERIARVSYYEGPWELVLQRVEGTALVTFYRGGKVPDVVIKDRPVRFADLAEGVVESARELELHAVGMDAGAEGDPLISMIRVLRENVSETLGALNLDEPSPALVEESPRDVVSTRWLTPRTKSSFSFGFRFRAGDTDILSSDRPIGSDLHSLLFNGQLVLHAHDRRLLLGSGYLYLQMERILALVRQLLSAWEEGKPISSRLVGGGLSVGIRLREGGELSLSFTDSVEGDCPIILNDIDPLEYAEAVIGVGRELRRHIVDTNPGQRRNLRLAAFSREVRSLSNWTKEQRRGIVINQNVAQYQRLAEPRRTPASGVSIREVSRLRFQENWRVEVEGLDLAGTMLCGEMSLVSARSGLLGIQTRDGAIAWRREIDPEMARIQVADQAGVVRVGVSGQVEFLDLFSGVRRWHTKLSPRSGGPPVVLVAEQGAAPGVVVTAEEQNRIVALDVRTGEPRWRFNASRAGRFALRRHGRLLYVSGGDNKLNAIDLENGSLVWRFIQRSRFLVPPAIWTDMMLLPGGRPGRREGRLYGIDAFSGQLQWDVPLRGGALTSPIVTDGVALLPVRIGRRQELVAIDTLSGEELWRKSCEGWAESCALMALDKRFIINTAGGIIYSLGARDGEFRWETVMGPTCSEDVPLGLRVVLRGGVLFVPADTVYIVRPDDGHVLHTFGGDPPVPDLLQVDPSCAVMIAEESGHVSLCELSQRLSIVPSE